MSTQADYTPDEWNVIVHAPAQASMLVVNSDKSGGIMGQFAIVQETKDARAAVQNAADTGVGLVKEAASSLLEETSWRPMIEGATAEKVTSYLQRANSIVKMKATPDEATAYRKYVYDVATHTASAVAETKGGPQTSDKEKVALQQIAKMIELNG
jgi:hypothetical protein